MSGNDSTAPGIVALETGKVDLSWPVEVEEDGVRRTKTVSVSFEPKAPSDFALATDIIQLGMFNLERAFAAALLVCWQGPHRPKVSYRQCNFSAGELGGRAMNEFAQLGIHRKEILGAGALCFKHLNERFIPRREVDETEGFTEPGEGEANAV